MAQKRPSTFLPFNPKIFRWARTRADFSPSEIAEKIKVKTQQIIDWESLTSSPTVKQARQLADFYGRPFLEFFAKEIPNVPETNLVPDFRMQRDTTINHDNKILKEVQSWGETQRLNALDLFEINGEQPPVFPRRLRAVVDDNPEVIAQLAREIISFPINEQINLRRIEKVNLVKIIRTKLENIGVLILKNSNLSKCDARGICIFNELMPVIIISSESPTGSTFTLCHEFAHIILRQSAVSGGIIFRQSRTAIDEIEKWCDHFAGAFLVPQDTLRRFINPIKKLAEIDDISLRDLANRFAVSRHAMLVRLVQLNIVESDYYWNVKRPEFLEQEKNATTTSGRATYYGSRYRNRNGDLYTGLVLEAWSNNRITNHNAAEFMGIKNIDHLFDIRSHFND